MIGTYAREILRRYSDGLQNAVAEDLVIHRRISRLSYSRRCAEASIVAACQKQGIPLAPGMEISYVVRDAKRWTVSMEKGASQFDAEYYGKLLEKAWSEVAYVFQEKRMMNNG